VISVPSMEFTGHLGKGQNTSDPKNFTPTNMQLSVLDPKYGSEVSSV